MAGVASTGKVSSASLLDVLAHGGKLRLDAAQLLVKGLAVQEFLNVIEFFFVEFGFKRAAARHHDHFFGGLLRRINQEPARDIHHHVAHADDRHALARGKITRGKRRQQVVAVNEVLGRINAPDLFAGQPQFLCPLRAHGKDDC